MPNKFKGTFEIEIDGEEYTLRPSFDAMEELVTLTNMSERQIYEAIQNGTYTTSMITSVIYSGIMGEHNASNKQSKMINRRVLGQFILMDGVTNYVTAALQFIMFAIVPYKTAAEAIERAKAEVEEDEEGDPQKKTVESSGQD